MRIKKAAIHLAALVFVAACLLAAVPALQLPALAADDNTDSWTQLPNVTEGGNRVAVDNKHYYVTPDGTAYFAYQVGTKVILRKLVGSTWTYLGSSANYTISGLDTFKQFAVAPNGTPYITVRGKVLGSSSFDEALFKFDGAKWVGVIKKLNYRADDLLVSSDNRPYVLTNIGIQFIDKSGVAQTLPICTINDNLAIGCFALGPDSTPYYTVQSEIDMQSAFDVYRFTVLSGKYTKVKVGGTCRLQNYIYNANLQISKAGIPYLAASSYGNSYSDAIYALSGNAWKECLKLPWIYQAKGHFFAIDSDSRFYILSSGSVYKSYGTKWLQGKEGGYDGYHMFMTTAGAVYADMESGYSYLAKYVFKPVIPTFSTPSICEDEYGNYPLTSLSLGNNVYIVGKLSTNEYAKVKAVVYNASNQIVASVGLDDQLSGKMALPWDGKATAGNTAGLKAGDYVPCSPTGVNYTIKLYAEDSAGGKYSSPKALKIIGKIPTIEYQECYSPMVLRPVQQTIAVCVANSDLPLTAVTTIRNSAGQTVAKMTVQSRPQESIQLSWDGKATVGVDAATGLKPGDLVPASAEGVSYKFKFTVSNAAGSVDSNEYDLLVKKELPTAGALTLNPTNGQYHLGSGSLSVNAPVTTVCSATVKLLIYDGNGKLAASVPYTIAHSVTNSFPWNGKATAGNSAGLTAGEYVPASSSGVDYTLKLSVSNVYGSYISSGYPIKVICNPPSLTSARLNPSGVYVTNGSTKLNVIGSLSSSVPCNVSAAVKNSSGKVVAQLANIWNPSASVIIAWDGRATTGNEAGLPAGSMVPQGQYAIKTVVKNPAGTAEAADLPFTLASSDVCLSSLTVKNNTNSYAISPMLNRTSTSYTANVPDTIASVVVKAVQEDAYAKIFYNQNLALNYGANTCSIKVTAQDGTLRTYQLKVTRAYPAKPTLSAITATPAVSSGFTPGGTNLLAVKTTVTTTAPALVELQVYNASGKLVAKVSSLNQSAGAKTLTWNGKATAGNAAGIAAGKVVPVSSAGTVYTLKVYASNPGGAVTSAALKTKLFSSPTVSGFSLTPTTFTPNASGTKTVRMGFKINHVSNVDIKIWNAAGKVVAILSCQNMAPVTLKYFYWNGKATAGNTAGYAAGTLVPAGKYSIQILAGSTVYRPYTKISVQK